MERKHKLRSILAFMLTFAMILGGLPSSFVSTVYANNSLTFSRTEKVDGMKVTVEADESVFPEGAALSVEKVGREEQEKAEETIESQRESGQMVAASYTYDVKMLDADGNEIQPEDGKRFKISFTLDEIADENLETNVYHIKESGSDVSVATSSAITEETDEVTVEKLDVETDGDTATAETDGFSLYTVEFTYNDLQYVLPGDSEVELSEILSVVGLSGEVTEVSVSDSSLFSAAKNASGEWIVTAYKAFSTAEWMKVTINGVEYEITVTDDNDNITTWAELQTALNTSCTITLTQDITATDSDSFLNIQEGVTVTLDLAGHTIERGLYKSDGSVDTAKENGLVLKVYGTLTLNDTGTGGKLTGGNNLYKKESSPDGGCIYVGSTGNFIMNGGEITYNKGGVSTAGGGIFVDGSMTMHGGTISHNTAQGNGGGIYVGESKTFTMTGGTIEYNTSAKRGGGIESYKQGTITMSGGTIAHNTAEQGGGIDSRNSGTINMSGGTIEYNSATGTSSDYLGGGGICIRGNSSALLLTITGGTIRENTSRKAGGGISVSYASAKITNATITNNTTQGYGGAIAITGDIWSQKYCLINGNTTITDNSSIGRGGAICADGHVRISDTAQITNNKTALASSGAVDLNSTSNLNVAGSVQITGNTITEGGSAANVKLNDGNIINGVTEGDTTTYLSSSASIGVAKGNPLVQDVNFLAADTTNNSEATLNFFSSDGGYLIKYDSGALKLSAYTITIQDSVPLSASQSRAKSGDTITLTPDAGYDVSNVTYSDGSQSYSINESNGVYTFTMPAFDVTVTAEYTWEKKPITISSSTNGNIVSDKSEAFYGETITLTITPDTGYVLRSLIVTADGSNVSVDGLTAESFGDLTWYNSSSVSFTMPGTAVTVLAEFEAKSNVYVTIPKTGSKSCTIPSGLNSFKVYNNSGKDGCYSSLENGTLVLTAPEGYVMHVTGHVRLYGTSALEDYLDIHDGNTTEATKLGQFRCTTGAGSPTNTSVDVTSNANQILLHFVTDGSGYITDNGGVYLTVTLVKLHTVSFANGGGTGTMDSVQVIDNREYTLPACGFTAPDNKKFKEWAVKIGDASVEAKAAGDKITVTADTAVTAVWEDKTAITPSVSIEGWTYGDAGNTPSVTGNDGNGTVTYEYKVKDAADSTYTNTAPTNVGEYTVRVTIGETDDYAGGMATADFTISPKKVELEWSNTSLTYNGSPQKPTATVKNLIENDICTVMVSGEKTDAGESYAATAMELSNSNYQLPATPTTSFSIDKKSVTISGITAVNKEYDGNTTAELDISGATVTGLVENDNISFSVSGAFENETKGADKTVNISGWTITSGGGNYKIDVEHSQKTATASITNTQVYISGITVSGKTYDGNASATIETGSLTIKKVRDDSVVDGLSAESIVAAFSDANTGNDKTVMISSATLTGGGNADYTLSIEKTNEKLNLKADIAQAEPDIGTVTADVLNNSTTVSDVRLQRTISTIPGTLELTSTSLNYGTNENCSWRFTPTDDTNYKTITGTVTIIVNDTIVPSGEISIKANKWSEFISTITFGWYKPTDKITITASDEGSGVKQISYFIYETTGTTGMTEQAVKDLEESKWSTYNSPVSISQDKKYIIYARITDNAGNVKYISSGGLAFDGTAPVIIGIDNNASIAFTTSGVELTITDGGELASITVDDTTENASGQSATKKITAAGTHTVKAEDKSGNKSTLTFTITKAAIDPTITISGWTYGGSANAPTVDGNTGNGTETIEYKLKTANDSAYSTAVPTDAGEYTVRVTIAASTNYHGGTATADFTITKAAISPTVTIAGWTYGGTASTPVLTGNSGNGAVTYEYKKQSEADSAYSTTVPTNAGDYTIRATVAESKNCLGNTATADFTIAKGTDPAVVAETATVQKGGKTIDLKDYVSEALGTVSFAFKNEDAKAGCSLSDGVLTSGTEETSVVITVTIAGSDNCKGRTAEITVSVVDKLTGTLTITQADITYGGAVAPSYTKPEAMGTETIRYTGTKRDGSAFTASSTTPTEAGSYSVAITYETNTTIYTGNKAFTIRPADINTAEVTLSDTLTYTGAEQTMGVSSVKLGTKTLTKDTDYIVTGNKGKDAGDYTLTVTAKDTSNYQGTATKQFVIGKVPLTVTIDAQTKKYGEADPTFTCSATGFVNSETADGLKTGSLTRDAGENVGEYAIKAGTLSYGGNYSISFTGAKLTITQADGDTTKPGKPELKSKTDTTITVNAVGGFEYQITPGGEWQNSGEFTGLTAGTEYSIITRKAETANVKAGAQSDALSVKTNAAAGQITEVIGKIGTGEIDVETVLEENVPQSTVSGMTAEFADSILTNEEKTAVSGGQKLTVTLDMKNIDSTVPADDKTKSETKAKEVGGSNAKVGLYLDISLFKQIGDGVASPVHETGGKKVHMVLSVPEGLRNRNTGIVRTFFIIRIHGDTAAKIAESTGTEIPFDSDLFSTYSLAYSDKSSGSGSDGNGGGSYSPGKTTPARPAAPALDSKTDASITVKTVAGQVYSIDGGKNWQASGTFTGLSPETEYSIVTKVSETSTSYESAVSDALKVKTDKKADASTPTTGPGGTSTPTNKPDDTAAPDSTTTPTDQPGETAIPDSTETPDTGKKPAAEGTVLVDAGKTAYYAVTSADTKKPEVAYKQCRNKKAKKVTIPQTVRIGGVTYTVTSIAANAFKNHKTITKVAMGKNIRTIGKNAFYGCKKLKTVTIGKNVTKIGAGAFSGCKKLVTVKMGSRVSVIGDKAFYNCASLKSITLPKTVKKIGKNAFYGCGKLKKITVKTKKLTLKNVGKDAFSGIYIRASVLVPEDKRKEYALLFRKRGAGKKIRIKTK